MVEQQTRNLREDLSRNIEATRQDVEATRRNLEATQRDLVTQLAALQVQTRRAGGSTLNEALNQAVKLEAAKAAAWPTARLREATRVPTERPPTPPECL
jgi:hypothetical protein